MPVPIPQALPPLAADELDRIHTTVGAKRWSQLRGAHLLLTGGTGFVGKWMLSSLRHADRIDRLSCRTTVLTRDAARFRDAAPHLAGAPDVRLVEGDVRAIDVLAGLVPSGDRFTHVIHAATDVAASGSSLETYATCVDGTRNVMRVAAAHVASVLIVSSGAVYGRQPEGMQRLEESYLGGPDVLDPSSAYAEGKRAAEWLAIAHGTEQSLRVTIARCFALVGPYLPLDGHFAIGNFLRDAMAGAPISIRGDGTPLRSYLHAADMAAWLWAIFLDGRSKRAYNVGGAEAISIEQLARRIVALVASPSQIRVLGVAQPGADIPRYVPDVTRARTELGLPEPWTLEEAIARTARWLARTARR